MIIVRLKGGMGNQLFQYALGRALAIHHQTTLGFDASFYENPGIPVRTYDLDLFAVQGAVLTREEIPFIHRSFGKGLLGRILTKLKSRILRGKGMEKGFTYNSNIFNVGSHIYLDGYWQNPMYFAAYEAQIRADLTIAGQLSEKVCTLEKEIQTKKAVCIHVRRGDYVGNAFHEVVGNSYYTNALNILREKVSIEHIYVFSDDIEWCKTTLSFDIPTTFVGEEYAGERAIGHFALMKSCTHFIIPNSSFSWWAAWLANTPNKIVIAPKQWFGDSNIDTKDRTPKDWIRI